MIARTKAIPLACYPYSSTSRIVHWLTQQYGKVSTLLKGARRPKSPFLGEYELFSTSELLYFTKRAEALHTAKECSMLHPRPIFRTDWRAMQSASYITALFNKTSPVEAPHPGYFERFEELLDLAAEFGNRPHFLHWAELRFCDYHGHAPHLDSCVFCREERHLRFSAASGGTICPQCARSKKLSFIECPSNVLDVLRTWQKLERPHEAMALNLSDKQTLILDTMAAAFMRYHFDIPIEQRHRATQRYMP